MKFWKESKTWWVGVGIIGAGVLMIMLVINFGGEVSQRLLKTGAGNQKEEFIGILTKTENKTGGDKFYLALDDYRWKNRENSWPQFTIEVLPVIDNWEKVRTMVGKNVRVDGIGEQDSNKMTIVDIEEISGNENITGKEKTSDRNWTSSETGKLGIRVRYPQLVRMKTGIFNGQETWVWEGAGGEFNDVWGFTIGSNKPWGGDNEFCDGENWGCREIGEMTILISGKEYKTPIWVTNSGGRMIQFKLEAGVGQPTVTGYWATKSQGQLVADMLRTIR